MSRTATTPEGNHAATTDNAKYLYASWVRWSSDGDGHKAGEQRIIGHHATYNAAKNNPNVRYFKKQGSVIESGVVEFIED